MSIYDFDFVQAIDGQIRISGIMRLRVIEQLAESLPPMWDWVGSTQYGGKNYTFQAIFDTFDKWVMCTITMIWYLGLFDFGRV